MLSETEFQQWCERLKISDEAKQEIQVIRSSEPSRNWRCPPAENYANQFGLDFSIWSK